MYMTCSTPGKSLADHIAGQQIFGVVAPVVDDAAHQIAVGIERAVAGLAHAQRVEREVAAIGRQAGLEAGDEAAAVVEIRLQLGPKLGRDRDVVGQDQHLVRRQIALGVEDLELVAGLVQHAVAPLIAPGWSRSMGLRKASGVKTPMSLTALAPRHQGSFSSTDA